MAETEAIVLLGERLPHVAIAVLLSLVVVGLTIVYFAEKRPRERVIILVGPSDAGKTTLWTLLKYNRRVKTIPSMQSQTSTNVSLPSIQGPDNGPSSTFTLIDTPGHPKLRLVRDSKLKEAVQKNKWVRVIFMIDSGKVAAQASEIALMLQECLELMLPNPNAKLLLVCNKNEQFISYSVQKCRAAIETEMQTLNVSGKAIDGQAIAKIETLASLENSQRLEIISCSIEKSNGNDIKNWITGQLASAKV